MLGATKQFPDINVIFGTAPEGKCDDTHFIDGETEVWAHSLAWCPAGDMGCEPRQAKIQKPLGSKMPCSFQMLFSGPPPIVNFYATPLPSRGIKESFLGEASHSRAKKGSLTRSEPPLLSILKSCRCVASGLS